MDQNRPYLSFYCAKFTHHRLTTDMCVCAHAPWKV